MLIIALDWYYLDCSVTGGERKGRLSFTLAGGLERGGDDSPCSRVGSLPSSEAETRGAVEGFDGEPTSEAELTPRVREGGADGPHCVRGPCVGLL